MSTATATCNPSRIINAARGTERVMYQQGNTRDIIETVLYADRTADQYINAKAVGCLRGIDNYATVRNVWAFVRNNLRYRADKAGHEVVKSPGALFHLYGKGDCKSYSIAAAALLRALGFQGQVYYRFAAYKHNPEYTHVYIVVKFSDGEVICDSVHTAFDDEVNYTKKKDYPANGGRSASVSGLPGYTPQPAAAVHGDISNIITAGIVGAVLYATYYFLSND